MSILNMINLSFLLLLSSAACSPVEKNVTATNANTDVSPSETGLIEDSSSIDNEDTDIELGEAPYILSAMGNFEDYPNIGKVIEITIDYLDAQNDVDDGFVHLQYSSSRASGNESFNIDGHEVVESDGVVTMAFRNVNQNIPYTFKVTLEDVEGHLSQQVEFDTY